MGRNYVYLKKRVRDVGKPGLDSISEVRGIRDAIIEDRKKGRVSPAKEMNDKAVSPVVGVILMVAITVILAAVIASYVFSIPEVIKRPSDVKVVVERVDGDTVRVVLTHGSPQSCALKDRGEHELDIAEPGDFDIVDGVTQGYITVVCDGEVVFAGEV